MIDKFAQMVRACKTLEQLFTLSAKIADHYAGDDEVLVYFEEICVDQLDFINEQQITKEALEGGKLIPTNGTIASA